MRRKYHPVATSADPLLDGQQASARVRVAIRGALRQHGRTQKNQDEREDSQQLHGPTIDLRGCVRWCFPAGRSQSRNPE